MSTSNTPSHKYNTRSKNKFNNNDSNNDSIDNNDNNNENKIIKSNKKVNKKLVKKNESTDTSDSEWVESEYNTEDDEYEEIDEKFDELEYAKFLNSLFPSKYMKKKIKTLKSEINDKELEDVSEDSQNSVVIKKQKHKKNNNETDSETDSENESDSENENYKRPKFNIILSINDNEEYNEE